MILIVIILNEIVMCPEIERFIDSFNDSVKYKCHIALTGK